MVTTADIEVVWNTLEVVTEVDCMRSPQIMSKLQHNSHEELSIFFSFVPFLGLSIIMCFGVFCPLLMSRARRTFTAKVSKNLTEFSALTSLHVVTKKIPQLANSE